MDKPLLVFTTFPDWITARGMAHDLVRKKLAACVNILPGVESVYRWKGEVEEATEITLLIKTTYARYPEVEAAIRANHAYEIPEILAVEVATGSPRYLDWIAEETTKELNA